MKSSLTKSAFFVLSGSSLGKFINVIALFLVTPILGPEGFGHLLIVGVVVALFNTIIDIGFEHYYIVKVNLTGENKTSDEDINAIENVVFLMRLYSNLILFSLQFILSYFLPESLFPPPTDLLLRILSFSYLGAIFGKINEVRFKKKIQFKFISQSKVVGDFGGALFKVILVFSGLGIIGWVIGTVIGNLIYSAMLALAGKFSPTQFTISAKWRKEVFWFAKHSWLSGFGIYATQQMHKFFLQAVFPIQTLGYFNFSNNYSNDLVSGIISPQSGMIMPYVANFKENSDKILKTLQNIATVYLVLIGPFCVLCIFFSYEIIQVLFGELWLPAAPLLAISFVYVLHRLWSSPCLGVLSALGKMKENTMMTYSALVIRTIAFAAAILLKFDIFWFTVLILGVLTMGDSLKAAWGLKFLRISYFNYLKPQLKQMYILAIVAIYCLVIKYSVDDINTIFSLIGICFGAIIIYLIAQYFIRRSALILLLDKAQGMLPQKINKLLGINRS